MGAQGDRSELQRPFSTDFWGKLVGFGLAFFWQEAPGIIFIHSFTHSVIINSSNRFLESHLHKKETI